MTSLALIASLAGVSLVILWAAHRYRIGQREAWRDAYRFANAVTIEHSLEDRIRLGEGFAE